MNLSEYYVLTIIDFILLSQNLPEFDHTFLFLELCLYIYTRLSSRELVPSDIWQRPSVGWAGGVAVESRMKKKKQSFNFQQRPQILKNSQNSVTHSAQNPIAQLIK